MSPHAELYEQDFYLWCLETCASLGAGEFDAIDVHHLIEEIRDLGNNVRSALESDLGIVVLHLLKWQYQPGGRQDSYKLGGLPCGASAAYAPLAQEKPLAEGASHDGGRGGVPQCAPASRPTNRPAPHYLSRDMPMDAAADPR
jgi:Domain of unknown function DUF29